LESYFQVVYLEIGRWWKDIFGILGEITEFVWIFSGYLIILEAKRWFVVCLVLCSVMASNSHSESKSAETKNSEVSSSSKTDGATGSSSNSSSQVDPDMDVSTPCWFYMDSNGLRQGPFSFKEMFLWWKGGFFQSELPAKTIWEDDFTPLSQIPQFSSAPAKLVERIEKEQDEQMRRGHLEVPMVPAYYEEPTGSDDPQKEEGGSKYHDYTVTGGFNPQSGKFQKDDASAYFTNKGVPADKDFRMMSHYFDPQQYQAMRQAAASTEEPKKKKLVKGSKKFWKERKEKKRRAKMIAEYLAD